MNRFYLLWIYAVTLISLLSAGLQTWIEERKLRADLNARMAALAASSEDSVVANYHARKLDRIARLAERLQKNPGITALSVCATDERGALIPGRSIAFPTGQGWEALCPSALTRQSVAPSGDWRWSESLDLSGTGKISVSALAHPLEDQLTLVVAQDLSELHRRWLKALARTFAFTWCLGMALLWLFAIQARGWLRSQLGTLHHHLRSLLGGPRAPAPGAHEPSVAPELAPLKTDLDRLRAKLRSLSPGTDESRWIASLREAMGRRKLVVIANREPYIHQRKGDRIEIIRPASGLVTALEPVLRQCGGLWVAHGSGSADAQVVDAGDEVGVPPGHPKYKLKRVWLSKEEENGYYYGFSNEGFWPLCHLAHNRPIFRLSDWEQYKAVNRKFAEAVPEASLGEDSLVLVQDYHFALLPRALRERTRGKIGLFWHIPWPNPEAFGICPWNEELLRGMLGSDVIGFHTQYHCNNFLDTCNRYLEARIDYERFTVTMENHVTEVRAFPIGIDTSPVRLIGDAEKEELKRKYGIKAQYVAVGVDRLDYTKGLIERVEGVERFLEKYPENVGRFTLVQMGSPSRSQIPAYRSLAEHLDSVVNRVNERFGERTPDGYKPVIFLASHHEWDEIQYFYQVGDVCMVTSLHDGMNLVAKEYVWCQRPDRGALILSKFAGASRELTEAFIVNPYSTEELADALQGALTLSPDERSHRMNAMREKVRTHNAFHWASDLIRAVIKKQDENASAA